MVNKNTRQTILDTLRDRDSWISGEELSGSIGISRVAVWKHIKALQEEGYLIESGHRGYRLTNEADTLSALEFPSAEGIVFYRELRSTMGEAARRMEHPEEEPGELIILADHQSAGVGRSDSGWDSPSGGIYMTCVINRPLPLTGGPLLPLRGILPVLQSLEAAGVEEPLFRWPGDIMIGDRKIGGVLEEYHVRGGRIVWHALGIGLHINNTPSDKGLSSVRDMTGLSLKRRDLISDFRERWEQALSLTPTELCRKLSEYADFLHRNVRLRIGSDEIVEGMADSLDTEGKLCLINDYCTIRISAGESIQLHLTGEI